MCILRVRNEIVPLRVNRYRQDTNVVCLRLNMRGKFYEQCLGPRAARGERGTSMSANAKIEKFSARELLNLRNELLQSGIDSWQAAEVLSGFLTGRGYGVSAEHARNAIARLEEMGCKLDCMQEELENLAFVM
jgi:hypothetical protein